MAIFFKTLRYKNFLSTGNAFTEISLDRSKTTLIVGANGAGKTTILDALSFSLYGRAFRSVNKPQLVNTITGRHAVVEVEFRIGGIDYLVRRGIKPNIFEIFKNGTLVPQDSNADKYQEYLTREVLKVDYKSFNQVIVLGSTNYTPFMTMKAEHRREVIEDLLDIQIFSTMNAILMRQREQTIEQQRNNSREIELVRKELDVHNEYRASNASNADILIAQLEERKRSLAREIVDKHETNTSLAADADQLLTKAQGRDVLQQKINDLHRLESEIATKIRNLNSNIHFFESNGECPTCRQEIDTSFKHETVTEHAARVEELTTAMTEIAGKRESVSIQLETVMSTVAAIRDIQATIASNNAEASALKRQIASIGDDIDAIKHRHDDKEINKEIKQCEARVKQLEIERKKLSELRDVQDTAMVLLKDSGIKTRIIRQYIPVINKLINKYLAAMNFFIDFQIDENFRETIKSSFRDDFTYQSFSEGEKLRINLAILFTWRAIAKMRNSMSTNLLIMDEIFDSSLDFVGVDDFLKIIDDLGGDTNVFIISHKDQLFDKFHSVIRFEKHKNFSRMAASN